MHSYVYILKSTNLDSTSMRNLHKSTSCHTCKVKISMNFISFMLKIRFEQSTLPVICHGHANNGGVSTCVYYLYVMWGCTFFGGAGVIC